MAVHLESSARGGLRMVETSSCPFNHALCAQCALYRGRHYYMNFHKQNPGYTDGQKKLIRINFQATEKATEPWVGKDPQGRDEPKVRLKVVDAESDATRICEIDEVKTWNWNNPQTLIMVDGRQVTSLNDLIEVLRYKADKGYQEVEVYEVPRFTLFAGG